MNDTFTYFQKKGCTVFSFPGKTRVLSTSPLNGGITAHLTHALNINCMNGAYECEMLGNTYEEDLNIHTKELGIDPQTATALSTAAWTELCAVEKICYQELSVTAAVTGELIQTECVREILLLTMKETVLTRCCHPVRSMFLSISIRMLQRQPWSAQ